MSEHLRSAAMVVIGVGLLAATAVGLDQPPGSVGAFDRLAGLDGSLRHAEWWGLPVADAVFGLVVVVGLGGALAGAIRGRGGTAMRLGPIGLHIAWFGVLVTSLSIGSGAAVWRSIPAPADRLPAGWEGWAIALAAVLAMAGLTHWSSARVGAVTGVRALATEPWSAIVAAAEILVLGASGVGFVRAGVCRLGVAFVTMAAGAVGGAHGREAVAA